MPVYPGPENALLRAVPPAQFRRMARDLVPARFDPGEVIHHPAEALRGVCFPLRGVISLLLASQPAVYVEVGMAGREGMIGLPVFFGVDTALTLAVAQSPIDALSLDAASFRRWLERVPPLAGVLRRYTQAFLFMVAQGSVCHQAHLIEKRCARWILSMQDRLGGDSFAATRDFFSRTLGVRRASVGQAAQRLEQQGLIAYGRGRLSIVDRPRLEKFACPCYHAIEKEFRRLLPERSL